MSPLKNFTEPLEPGQGLELFRSELKTSGPTPAAAVEMGAFFWLGQSLLPSFKVLLASPPIHLVQLFFSLPIYQVASATMYESRVVAGGVAWKSFTTSPGERYVMMAGPCKAPLWSAG